MKTKEIVLLLSCFVVFSILFPVILILIRSKVNWFFTDDYEIIYTSQFLAYLISFLLFPKVLKHVYSEFNLTVIRQIKTYMYIGVAFITLYIINLFINSDVMKLEYSDWKPTWLIITLIVVLIPFFEEILFRGVLYKFMILKKGKLFTIGFTTILFAILHSDNFLFFTIMGIILSILRNKTNSITSSYIMHAAWNGYSIFAIYN